MTTTPSESAPAAARSFDRRCEAHQWPLRTDGTCARCEADAALRARGVEKPLPCPAHETWSRDFKRWLLTEFLLEKSQGGTHAERIQRSWEGMLHTVAHARGVLLVWTTPAVTLLERLTEVHARQTTTTDAPTAGAAGKE